MRLLVLILWVSISVGVIADEPPVLPTKTPPAKEQIVLEDGPLTSDQVLAQFAERSKAAEAVLNEAQWQFNKTMESIEEATVDELKRVARNDASKGEIASATEIWTEVLKLRPQDEDAKKFLATINRLDLVQKQIAASTARTSAAKPKLRVEFKCESGRVFKKLANGLWSDSGHAPGHQEVYRDESMVVLRDPTGIEHALLSRAYLWGSRKDRTGSDRHLWWDGELGTWTR